MLAVDAKGALDTKIAIGTATPTATATATTPAAAAAASVGAPPPTASPAPAKEPATTQNVGVRVVVRVRPVLGSENNQHTQLLKIRDSTSIQVVVPSKQTNTGKDDVTIAGIGSSASARANTHSFGFDQVLSAATTQSQLFEQSGIRSILQSVLQGFHGTIFAYGQTGSGKTHTMDGLEYGVNSGPGAQPRGQRDQAPSSPSAPSDRGREGVSLRCIHTLFELINQQSSASVAPGSPTAPTAAAAAAAAVPASGPADRTEYTVRCSFIQIYQESVYDLLSGSDELTDTDSIPGLRVRWSPDKEFFVENMFTFQCHTEHDARDYFLRGIRKRVTAAHRLNAHSSRSHSLFTLYVESNNPAYPDQSRSSKLTLVDLAGSERQHVTGASGVVLKQSISVNKSLFVLRKVIQALAHAQSNGAATLNGAPAGTGDAMIRLNTAASGASGAAVDSRHIPFRDSVLTRLLKHSLGGSCFTLMIACLCPTDTFVDENLSTLNYGAMAKQISNAAVVNEDPKVALIRKLRAEIVTLKAMLSRANEMVNLQARLGTGAPGGGTINRQPTGTGTSLTIPYTSPPKSAGGGSGRGPSPSPAPVSGGGGSGSASSSSASVNERFIDSVSIIRELMVDNRALRASFVDSGKLKENLEFNNRILNHENAELRDRIQFLEAVIVDGGRGTGGAGGPSVDERFGTVPTARPATTKVGGSGGAGGVDLSADETKDIEIATALTNAAAAAAAAKSSPRHHTNATAASPAARFPTLSTGEQSGTPKRAAAGAGAANAYGYNPNASPRSGGVGTTYQSNVAIPIAKPPTAGKSSAGRTAAAASKLRTPTAAGAGGATSPTAPIGFGGAPSTSAAARVEATWQSAHQSQQTSAAAQALASHFNLFRSAALGTATAPTDSGQRQSAFAETYKRLYGRRRMMK